MLLRPRYQPVVEEGRSPVSKPVRWSTRWSWSSIIAASLAASTTASRPRCSTPSKTPLAASDTGSRRPQLLDHSGSRPRCSIYPVRDLAASTTGTSRWLRKDEVLFSKPGALVDRVGVVDLIARFAAARSTPASRPRCSTPSRPRPARSPGSRATLAYVDLDPRYQTSLGLDPPVQRPRCSTTGRRAVVEEAKLEVLVLELVRRLTACAAGVSTIHSLRSLLDHRRPHHRARPAQPARGRPCTAST